MFEQIEFSQVKENVVDLIARQWALVTAGDEKACNTMTVSWGAVGELWGVDTATVYIRPQRYTEQFIDSNDYFTVCFFPEELKQQIHGVCGSKSGRDTDKIAEAGITPVYDENAPYFEQAKLVLVCRKMAKGKFEPAQLCDKGIADKWYPENDYHNIYYGTIEKVLIKK